MEYVAKIRQDSLPAQIRQQHLAGYAGLMQADAYAGSLWP
jgi:hypothetical protein